MRTPETELLILCARLKLEPRHEARLRRLADEGLDWAAAVDAAWLHGLLPLLHTHLAALGLLERVPEPARGSLQRSFTSNVQWNLRLSHELREVLRDFERDGIPAFPYKGPVLAQQLYGSVALRENADLDVVVPQADVDRAHERLLARGYRISRPLSSLQHRSVQRFEKSCEYIREPHRTIVELHWSFTGTRARDSLEMAELLERCRWLPFMGSHVRVFHPRDLLLLLSVHGCRHLWERLEWLCGVAELIRASAFDWDDVLAEADRASLRRVLLLGAGLAHALLEAPVPEEVLRRIREDPELPTLLEQSEAFALQRREEWSFTLGWPFHRYQLRLKERRREKARYLCYALLAPAHEDWTAVPLPDQLFPLYHVIRPIRLSSAYLQRLARSWR